MSLKISNQVSLNVSVLIYSVRSTSYKQSFIKKDLTLFMTADPMI